LRKPPFRRGKKKGAPATFRKEGKGGEKLLIKRESGGCFLPKFTTDVRKREIDFKMI